MWISLAHSVSGNREVKKSKELKVFLDKSSLTGQSEIILVLSLLIRLWYDFTQSLNKGYSKQVREVDIHKR